MKKIAKMILIGYLACQSVGLQAQTLIIDGKEVAYHLPPISLYVNKQPVQTIVMAPIQLNNRVLVPSREVFEAMGAKVGWNHSIKEVNVAYKGKKIALSVNQTTATLDGNQITMDVPAKIINDKVMIPVRFVSEAIGMKVTWQGEERAVWIEEPKEASDNQSGNGSSNESQKQAQIESVATVLEKSQYKVTIGANGAMEQVKVSILQGKIILDIPNSRCLLDQSISVEDNPYVKGIRTSQFTADTTRVVLDLKNNVKIETSYSTDRQSLYVALTKDGDSGENNTPPNNSGGSNSGTVETPDDHEIQKLELYTVGNKPQFNLSRVESSKIKVNDDYRSKTLTFDLGADYSQFIPNTELMPNDAYVASISVHTSGTTKLKVVTKSVYTYKCIQNKESVTIQLVKPREQYDQIVVIDIGHGGSDAGAVGNGLKEKDINYNQGMALFKLLETDPNIKVYMTREFDVYPTLQFRSQLANDIQADLFVSLHNNSAASHVVGTETLYFPSTINQTGKEVASLVQNKIVQYCGTVNRGIKPRSDLYVLRTTNMPAVLIETGFISNPYEAQLINSPSFIKSWAQGVYEAIVEGMKLVKR